MTRVENTEELLGFTPALTKPITDEEIKILLRPERLREQKYVQGIIDTKKEGNTPDPLGR